MCGCVHSSVLFVYMYICPHVSIYLRALFAYSILYVRLRVCLRVYVCECVCVRVCMCVCVFVYDMACWSASYSTSPVGTSKAKQDAIALLLPQIHNSAGLSVCLQQSKTLKASCLEQEKAKAAARAKSCILSRSSQYV